MNDQTEFDNNIDDEPDSDADAYAVLALALIIAATIAYYIGF